VDEFTKFGPLCDNGIVTKSRPMWHGNDYICTGSAHYAGEHIKCSDIVHQLIFSCYVKRYGPDGWQGGYSYTDGTKTGKEIIIGVAFRDGKHEFKAYVYPNGLVESFQDGWQLD